MQLSGRRPDPHPLCRPVQSLQGAFASRQSSSVPAEGPDQHGAQVPADGGLTFTSSGLHTHFVPFFFSFQNAHRCHSKSSFVVRTARAPPISGSQRGIRLVAGPRITSRAPQSSYLCRASLGLSICQLVCFALCRRTMIPPPPHRPTPLYSTLRQLHIQDERDAVEGKTQKYNRESLEHMGGRLGLTVTIRP